MSAADRTIEHDVEAGCRGCRLLCGERHVWYDSVCVAAPVGIDQVDDPPRWDAPAPAWCPLRGGQVTVRAKGGGRG